MPYSSIEKRNEYSKMYLRKKRLAQRLSDAQEGKRKYGIPFRLGVYHGVSIEIRVNYRGDVSCYWFKKHTYTREARREKNLQDMYGISQSQYASLELKQHGTCAICGNPPRRYMRSNGVVIDRLFVDHNHVTGKTRGLLCSRCNICLAFLENPELRENANRYLILYNET